MTAKQEAKAIFADVKKEIQAFNREVTEDELKTILSKHQDIFKNKNQEQKEAFHQELRRLFHSDKLNGDAVFEAWVPANLRDVALTQLTAYNKRDPIYFYNMSSKLVGVFIDILATMFIEHRRYPEPISTLVSIMSGLVTTALFVSSVLLSIVVAAYWAAVTIVSAPFNYLIDGLLELSTGFTYGDLTLLDDDLYREQLISGMENMNLLARVMEHLPKEEEAEQQAPSIVAHDMIEFLNGQRFEKDDTDLDTLTARKIALGGTNEIGTGPLALLSFTFRIFYKDITQPLPENGKLFALFISKPLKILNALVLIPVILPIKLLESTPLMLFKAVLATAVLIETAVLAAMNSPLYAMDATLFVGNSLVKLAKAVGGALLELAKSIGEAFSNLFNPAVQSPKMLKCEASLNNVFVVFNQYGVVVNGQGAGANPGVDPFKNAVYGDMYQAAPEVVPNNAAPEVQQSPGIKV